MSRLFAMFHSSPDEFRGWACHPATRLMAAASLSASCLVSDPLQVRGGLVILGAIFAAWSLLRPQLRRWGAVAMFGLAMFVPVFFFFPWVQVPEGSPGLFSPDGLLLRLTVPWRIVLRGEAVLLVTGAVAVSLSTSELQAGLARLPLPRFLVALIAQILHHTGMLAMETRRIGQAVAVRGGTTGLRASMLVARSLPSTWLPRVIERADRVAAAMELRGFDGMPFDFEERRFRFRDALILLSSAVWMAGASLLRWGGIP